MKAVKNLSWVFNWLAGLGQGSSYEVVPVVQPVVDVSMDFPIPIQVYNGDFTAAAGTNTLNLPSSSSTPASWSTGRARLWLALSVFVSANPAGGAIVLAYEQNQLTTRRVSLWSMYTGVGSIPNNQLVPVIGNSSAVGGGAFSTIQFQGLKPQYVADPDRLILFLTAMAGAETILVRGLFLEVPSSSPLPYCR